jgi:hypothetical protein
VNSFPGIPLPPSSSIRTPVDVKLKSGWRFEPKRRIFRSDTGEEFKPSADLPTSTKIVYKVPSLANANKAQLSRHEMALRRYMQVILPKGQSPADYVELIRSWPCVAEAYLSPVISLPLEA